MPTYYDFWTAFEPFKNTYAQWQDEVAGMSVFRIQMQEFRNAEDWHSAFSAVSNWMKCVERIQTDIFDMDENQWARNWFFRSIYYAWKEAPVVPEVEVTMDAILSVMVTASDTQLMNFIGLVDAYRQSLWNKDFNVDLFAALARGFQ